MILIENEKIYGWETAIRGMRNPKNSWDRSDTFFASDGSLLNGLGQNDYKLMMKLSQAGQVHGKFLRMINVAMDITAPLYWWKEFDTYKVGTVCNSCSTMHKIHSKEFTYDDFSTEHLLKVWDDEHLFVPLYEDEEDGQMVYTTPIRLLNYIMKTLNYYRKVYLETKEKKYWWQMIQLLPSSYNQRRTIQLNYAVLKNIYEYRKNHKLDEWVDFCIWIEKLPYSQLITGELE